MRYAILIVPVLILFAIACGEGDEQEKVVSTGTPAPAAGELDIRDLLLRPEDVPPELGELSEPQVQTAEEFIEGQFGDPLEPEPTPADLPSWGLISSAVVQAYPSPDPETGLGPQLMVVGVTLTDNADGAKGVFRFGEKDLDRSAIEKFEADPGRDVVEYEELDEPTGDESRMVYYISVAQDDPERLENYQLAFRRDRVVAFLQVRAPEGNVTLDQVVDLANKLDSRIEEGLR